MYVGIPSVYSVCVGVGVGTGSMGGVYPRHFFHQIQNILNTPLIFAGSRNNYEVGDLI